MPDATATVDAVKAAVRRFAADRGWDPYHSPKNLALALASEVGELCEPFRWLSEEESRRLADDPASREAVADELADVFGLLLQLSVHTGIDLSDAVAAKLIKNAVKYPAPAGG